MGLYHTVGVAYGFEIPDANFDALTAATAGLPIGYMTIGDRDKTFLVTGWTSVDKNTAARLTPESMSAAAQAGFDEALHEAATRLGHPDHDPPAWLVLHDYS
ncbi:hypothetical protein ACFWR9_09020 [Streptomyces sp. NPDC058534]|uniref:hypothetical protein n=1 Tax=Streptomyces sp. NPDC058534 TaxID=3346541 RepID=UPI003663F77B